MGFISRATPARDFFCPRGGLGSAGLGFALLHEGILGRTREFLAAFADGLGFAHCLDVRLAFLDEGRLGRARQWLAVLTEGLGFTAGRCLGKSNGGTERKNQSGDEFHGGVLSGATKMKVRLRGILFVVGVFGKEVE